MEVELRVQDIARQQIRVYPRDAGFLEALDSFALNVRQIPSEFSVDLGFGNPRDLWPDRAARFNALLETVDSWINYILYVTASSARSLQRSVVAGLNEQDYLRCVSAVRALLELAGAVHQTVPDIVQTYAQLGDKRDATHVFTVLAETSSKLQLYASKTRFDWKAYVESAFKTPPQQGLAGTRVSFQKLIDALPQETRGTLYAYYRLLCDFVHPSVGMQNLFIEGVDMKPVANGKWARYRLSRESHGDELLWMTLHVVSVPARASLNALSAHIGALREMASAHRSLLPPQSSSARE